MHGVEDAQRSRTPTHLPCSITQNSHIPLAPGTTKYSHMAMAVVTMWVYLLCMHVCACACLCVLVRACACVACACSRVCTAVADWQVTVTCRSCHVVCA